MAYILSSYTVSTAERYLYSHYGIKTNTKNMLYSLSLFVVLKNHTTKLKYNGLTVTMLYGTCLMLHVTSEAVSSLQLTVYSLHGICIADLSLSHWTQ